MAVFEGDSYNFETRVIHSGQKPCPVTGAVMPPVYQTSTYIQKSPGEHTGFEYSRTRNPSRDALAASIAALENGKFGLCFASGCAASSAIMHCLKQGDHVIVAEDVYGGTFRLFDKVFSRAGINFDFIDLSDLENIKKHIKSETKMIWLETPSNPMMMILDIEAICDLAKEKGLSSVVDNTFATPCLQNPLNLGADLVVHSTTKYLGGHSDVVGGAIATSDPKWYEELAFVQNSAGNVPGPWDCFLTLRGIKTLAIRMDRHCQNAKTIAAFLSDHPEVEKVIYPGLESHPGHQLAKKQMKDFGGMLSFVLKGDLDRAKKVLSSFKVFSLAESLGGVESLIEHPAIMTHASIPKDKREELGILDGFIRLSVGIENIDDLIQDLKQALV